MLTESTGRIDLSSHFTICYFLGTIAITFVGVQAALLPANSSSAETSSKVSMSSPTLWIRHMTRFSSLEKASVQKHDTYINRVAEN